MKIGKPEGSGLAYVVLEKRSQKESGKKPDVLTTSVLIYLTTTKQESALGCARTKRHCIPQNAPQNGQPSLARKAETIAQAERCRAERPVVNRPPLDGGS